MNQLFGLQHRKRVRPLCALLFLRANINKLIVITKFLAKKVNVISEMCQLKDILISFSDHGVGSCDHLLKIRFLTLKNANLFVFSSLNRNFALSLQKN